jgi:hypothetical protein
MHEAEEATAKLISLQSDPRAWLRDLTPHPDGR